LPFQSGHTIVADIFREIVRMPAEATKAPKNPRVALFVTCLVDFFRPSVGFAALRLLEGAGCTVEVPRAQTCCGQPAYNSGDRADTKTVAEQVIRAFAGYDYVVVPSGSCAGMIRKHYPALFKDDPDLAPQAEALAARTFELVSFLTDVLGVTGIEGRYEGTVTYHDSCSGLRELGIKAQPRRLLQGLEGLNLKEMDTPEVCCGFGGTFCVKYPDISNEMVESKAEDIEASGAGLLLAGDLGCLLNMAGKLKRRGAKVEVRHVAEVLAGELDQPGIGEGADDRAAAEAARTRSAAE
jgi:L-lactate dehydrogenase complex protein LldE